ncbi:MAG: ParA family protein [Dysgonomonas sp.]
MKRKPLFVAFSTQKGGVGKTVFTVLVASYLHYQRGYKVGIVDCDYPQFSIEGMRKREERIITEDDHYKLKAYQQFSQENMNAYLVMPSTGEEAIQTAASLTEESAEDLDFIFFDLPGTLNSEGIITTLSQMDYIFSPISADRFVLESTLEFTSLLNEHILSMGKGNLKGLYLFWTLVDKRERSNLYDAYADVIAELGLQLLHTWIPERKCFRHELEATHKPIFRSSFFAADKQLVEYTQLDLLVDEILSIIKI